MDSFLFNRQLNINISNLFYYIMPDINHETMRDNFKLED